MKAILMSIRPQWVVKILNGNKTIEIRKKFPKDYVGWVYIYVTKALPHLAHSIDGDYDVYDGTQLEEDFLDLNGKVVARFWCDKVEEIENKPFTRYGYPRTKTLDSYDLAKYSCVDNCDIKEYLAGSNGVAIHITKLEIFDKPKEISEFDRIVCGFGLDGKDKTFETLKPLTKAPQSYCFIRDVL